jgi:transposase
MSRYDLNFEWRVIEPLLPSKPRGVPRVDDRRVLNGIFWVLRSVGRSSAGAGRTRARLIERPQWVERGHCALA